MDLRYFIFVLFVVSSKMIYSQTNENIKYSEGFAVHKILKDKKTVYGFVNHKGKLIIPAVYDTIYSNFKSGFAAVGKNSRLGVIDKKGETIVPFEFKEMGEMSKGVIPVKNHPGLWGFYDHTGIKVSEPLFQNYRYGARGKIIVQKDGKWGMINDKGEEVLGCHYKAIRHGDDKNYETWKMVTWNVRNIKNEIILSVESDSLSYAGEGLYRTSIIGKPTLLNEKGDLINGVDYEEVGNFKNGLAKAKRNKYGVINTGGKMIVPFEYDDVIIDSLFIRVKSIIQVNHEYKNRWGLYDKKGNILIPLKYAHMNSWSDGMIAAMKDDGTWGYISSTGSTEIIFRYAYADDFKGGLARVKVPYWLMKKDLYAIIDKTGEYVVSPADYNSYSLGLIKIGRDGKIEHTKPADKYSSYEKINNKYIRVSLNDKFGLIDSDDKEIVPPMYDSIFGPSETGLIVVEKEGKSGVINLKGQFTFKLNNKYERIFPFHEGFAKVQLKGKFGFIDQHGDVYISAQYQDAGDISEGMVNVILRDKWAFVDTRENLKIQPYYDEVTPFKNGIALVKEAGKWNIINKEGQKFHKNDFDKIEKTNSGKYLLTLGNRFGLADKNGKEVLAPKYEKILELGNNMVMVKKNNLWGVLDFHENFIIPIEHEILIYEPGNNTFITASYGKQEQMYIK